MVFLNMYYFIPQVPTRVKRIDRQQGGEGGGVSKDSFLESRESALTCLAEGQAQML